MNITFRKNCLTYLLGVMLLAIPLSVSAHGGHHGHHHGHHHGYHHGSGFSIDIGNYRSGPYIRFDAGSRQRHYCSAYYAGDVYYGRLGKRVCLINYYGNVIGVRPYSVYTR